MPGRQHNWGLCPSLRMIGTVPTAGHVNAGKGRPCHPPCPHPPGLSVSQMRKPLPRVRERGRCGSRRISPLTGGGGRQRFRPGSGPLLCFPWGNVHLTLCPLHQPPYSSSLSLRCKIPLRAPERNSSVCKHFLPLRGCRLTLCCVPWSTGGPEFMNLCVCWCCAPAVLAKMPLSGPRSQRFTPTVKSAYC